MTSSFPFLSKKTIFYNMEAFLYLNKGHRTKCGQSWHTTSVQNNSISIHCSLLLHPRRRIPARLLDDNKARKRRISKR
jgi:hypothetical protein